MSECRSAWKSIKDDFEALWKLPPPTKDEPFPEIPSSIQHHKIVFNIGKYHTKTLGNFDKSENEKSLNALLDLAAEFDLSERALYRLMKKLHDIAVDYAWDISFGSGQSVGKAQSSLTLIQQNLERLANFNTEVSKAGNLADRSAKAALVTAFQLWAVKRLNLIYWINQRLGGQTRNGEWLAKADTGKFTLEHSADGINRLKRWREQFAGELKRAGVTLETPVILSEPGSERLHLYYSSFDAAAHISTFFGLAELLSAFAKDVPATRAQTISGTFTVNDILVGKTLRALYEKYTKKKFGFSKPYSTETNRSERARNIGGVRFSNLCMRAMGLEDMEPETIRTKILEAKKGSKRTR